MKNGDPIVAVSLRQVSFCRDYIPLFQDLNLDIVQGSWLSIRGKNGVGKSTLLKLMAGLLIPDSGEIIVGNSTRLSYLGHQNGQRSHLTLKGQLAAKGMMMDSQVNLDGIMERCHLSALGDIKISHLSAGQQRQGALAGLLFCPQSLWLLDEPFEHLDREGKERFMEIFQEHVQRGGAICQTSHEDSDQKYGIKEWWLPASINNTIGAC